MKTLVVISDSHGRRGAVDRVKHLFAENDYIVHLGDGSTDLRHTMSEFPDKTYILRGNCDFAYGEDECIINVEGVSILCCHGHRYGVKGGLAKLAYRAKELNCEVALYGHTHRANVEDVGGVLCVNPGALGSYSDASYAYVVVHGNKVTVTVVPLS